MNEWMPADEKNWEKVTKKCRKRKIYMFKIYKVLQEWKTIRKKERKKKRKKNRKKERKKENIYRKKK